MGDIIGWVLFFGLEIVAIFILILSALYGRQLVFVIICGIVAAVVMAAESIFCFICAAGGYASEFGGDALPVSVSAVSIVSLFPGRYQEM
jgi:hypothetical protein